VEPTRYYVVHTDLEGDSLREVVQRITLMAEEYHERTKDFSGSIRTRLPFYLFSDVRDYYAAGGLPGSAGVYTGDRLMAVVGPETGRWSWHVIQHEGFHQFADAVIGGRLPPWVNEGLAEYFGVAVFTGDGFTTGVIPPERLGVVRTMIEKEKYAPFIRVMQADQEIWNTHLVMAQARGALNYLQSWSMVQFLAHAEDGKYRPAFGAFLRAVGQGKPWEQAWSKSFGGDVTSFEGRWRSYWRGLPDNPSAALYAEATVRTLTGFVARAVSQRQAFASADEFFAAAAAGDLRSDAGDWLPPALLTEALERAAQTGAWTLKRSGGRTELICELANGVRIRGTFVLKEARVQRVKTEVLSKQRRERG